MALTIEQLETFQEQKIKEIADAFRTFVKQEYADGEMSDWPRLYYIDQGKSGYSDGAQEQIRNRVYPIWGHRELFLHCDSLKILRWSYSQQNGETRYVEASNDSVAELTPESVDLHSKMKELKKAYRYDKHGGGGTVIYPNKWLKTAILIGLDLSYADLKSHFRGVEREKIYQTVKSVKKQVDIHLNGVKLTDLNEQKFLAIKQEFMAKMAQKIMMRNRKKERYQIWPETDDDILEDE
jgi:hypothetical protein